MTTDNKKPRFNLTAIAISIGGFLVAWIATKLMDTYLDTALLSNLKDLLLGMLKVTRDWLIEEKPQPTWLLVSFIISILILGCLIFYFARLYTLTLNSLNEERASKTNPTIPKLTSAQRMAMIRLAGVLEGGEMLGSITSFGRGTLFNSLDDEMALEQLELMGLVKFTNPTGTNASTRKPTLTLKGMEYVSARRKATAEKEQLKAKGATPAS
ncbi:hypothetical protein [Pseudomonas faucium]|uniref:hypothetical protein n=1 Tax=Pseudomonas faucium TaxID=2740518 RepID=UPI001596DA12|nr:hypothetical protein [Pseudomonas faucium]